MSLDTCAAFKSFLSPLNMWSDARNVEVSVMENRRLSCPDLGMRASPTTRTSRKIVRGSLFHIVYCLYSDREVFADAMSDLYLLRVFYSQYLEMHGFSLNLWELIFRTLSSLDQLWSE